MSRQLTFDGVEVEVQAPRVGCIGKVERLIEARPWLTCGEIAAEVQEPSGRVSMALNKLKREGRAQQRTRLGAHRRSAWAGTSEGGKALRETVLAEAVAANDEAMALQLADRLPRAFLKAGAGDFVGAVEA